MLRWWAAHARRPQHKLATASDLPAASSSAVVATQIGLHSGDVKGTCEASRHPAASTVAWRSAAAGSTCEPSSHSAENYMLRWWLAQRAPRVTVGTTANGANCAAEVAVSSICEPSSHPEHGRDPPTVQADGAASAAPTHGVVVVPATSESTDIGVRAAAIESTCEPSSHLVDTLSAPRVTVGTTAANCAAEVAISSICENSSQSEHGIDPPTVQAVGAGNSGQLTGARRRAGAALPSSRCTLSGPT